MQITKLAGSAAMIAVLAACSTVGDGTGPAPAPAAGSETPFAIESVSITPMTQANLCAALGGQGQAPAVTIRHSATAGVPIRLHMQDRLSDGSTFNHFSTRVSSDGSGTTTISHRFLPPCNTTAGRLNSHYQLTVEAGGKSTTVSWARYNSGSRQIH